MGKEESPEEAGKARAKAAMDRDARFLEEPLPEAERQIRKAEGKVRTMMARAQAFGGCKDGTRQASLLLRGLAEEANHALTAVEDAPNFLNSKYIITRRFNEALNVKAISELGVLRQRLVAAQDELSPWARLFKER